MREWFLRLALMVLGSIIGMIALEFGLSKFAPHPKTWPIGFHVRNKYIGWKGIPGKEGRWVKGRIVSYVKMNSHGFRDKERNYKKEQDVFRIVVLGDSCIEGLQVPLEQTFPYILEKRLNSESRNSFEVINLGVSGFGTAQEYLTLRHYGLKYNPDLVILAFYINNDLKDNSKILGGVSRDKKYINRPYFVLENGKLKEIPFKIKGANPAEDERQHKIGVIEQLQISRDLLAKLFPNTYYSLSDRINETPWLTNLFWKIGIKKSRLNPVLSDESKDKGFNNVYAEEYPPEWRNAWEVTKALILKISEELEMKGIGFLVVIIPKYESQTDRFELLANLDKYSRQRTVKFDLEKPERILSDFLEESKIDYLLLRPEFEKYIRETGKDLRFRYSYEDHWNANAHDLAAQLIYEEIKR